MKALKRIAMTSLVIAAMVVTTACSDSSITSKITGTSKSSDSTKTSDSINSSANATILSASKDDGEIFTDRDLKQEADTTEAEKITLESGKDITITKEGVYILSGNATDSTVFVEADDAKVQLVLDGVSITNSTEPCIYVKSADKVFVTTTDSKNTLAVTEEFQTDGDKKTDAVIFSKDDIVVNGVGTIDITSLDNGISSKDKLKITGSTINVNCSGSAFEAHDGVYVADGTINETTCNDGIHAEDNDDDTVGEVYVKGGTITITANDDAIHATTIVCIDGGEITLTAKECIEGTYIVVNDGKININASDDGINAAAKSTKYTPTYEQNGGDVVIVMGQGDTDGVDSNGDIYINGGTIDISGQSTFDYDGNAEYKGGTIIENGTETNTITNQFFGGNGGGGFGGDMQRPNGEMNGDGNMQPPSGEMNGNGRMQPPSGEMNGNGRMQPPSGGNNSDNSTVQQDLENAKGNIL